MDLIILTAIIVTLFTIFIVSLMRKIRRKKEQNRINLIVEQLEEDEWCHYSNMPSPNYYKKCADYDGIGNHGRFDSMKKTK